MRGDIAAFQSNLLQWFKENQRQLPWRTVRSTYRTVVSEFMLQQTQVDTVIPYFENWMLLFPDFQTLARAPEEDVLKAWEGLGYYSRARNLHKLAKALEKLPVPNTPADWIKLPGIGPYSSAAISSIAQNHPVPVIDGNVIRVLSRLFDVDAPVKSASQAQGIFLPLAEDLITSDTPGDFNEAMMELGATTCLKSKPLCLMCPVRSHCKVTLTGEFGTRPNIIRKQSTSREINRLFALDKDRLFVLTHPASAQRLAGISELPELPKHLLKKSQLEESKKRTISNERITEHIYTYLGDYDELNQLPDCEWVAIEELSKRTLSAPHKRWISQRIYSDSL